MNVCVYVFVFRLVSAVVIEEEFRCLFRRGLGLCLVTPEFSLYLFTPHVCTHLHLRSCSSLRVVPCYTG